MTGFTKLFQDIVTSSIWSEDDKTRLVWITMLALADMNGIVSASVSGLAHMARVGRDECERALEKLSSPDADSRSTEHEGRRIEKRDGGWLILNHAKYRDKFSVSDRRDYQRVWQREYRKRRKVMENGAKCDAASTAIQHGLEDIR